MKGENSNGILLNSRTHKIRQEFTTADSPIFNEVDESHITLVESAGMAAQV